MDFESETFITAIQGAATRENPDSGLDGVGVRTDGKAFTLEARSEVQAVAFGIDEEQNAHIEQMGCLKARIGGGKPGQGYPAARIGMQVRRLTPIETARLQGVPDDHCRIPYKGRMMADGPVYKMHGNGFAVPVIRWIGKRLQEIM